MKTVILNKGQSMSELNVICSTKKREGKLPSFQPCYLVLIPWDQLWPFTTTISIWVIMKRQNPEHQHGQPSHGNSIYIYLGLQGITNSFLQSDSC